MKEFLQPLAVSLLYPFSFRDAKLTHSHPEKYATACKKVVKACKTLAQQFLSSPSSVAAFFRFVIMSTGICVAFFKGMCECGRGRGCIIYMLLMISRWLRKQFLMISYDSIMHSIRSCRCCCCCCVYVIQIAMHTHTRETRDYRQTGRQRD